MMGTRPMPLLLALIAVASHPGPPLSSTSSPSLFALADNVAVKLPAGGNPGAFMPFTFGGVHTQKGRCGKRGEREREEERKISKR